MLASTLYTAEALEATVRRVTLRSAVPHERVLTRFVTAFPLLAPESLYRWVDRGDAEAFRAFLESLPTPSGFFHFQSFDQGGGMSLLGIPLRSRYFLVGNVLLATDLFRRELAAGLAAPVRVAITGTDDGTQLDYDVPSSIFSQFPALRDSAVPGILDARLEALFSTVMSDNGQEVFA